MQVKTKVRAGGVTANHNETLAQAKQPTTGLKVKTGIKAGGFIGKNDNSLIIPGH